jgi:hypothetical protein
MQKEGLRCRGLSLLAVILLGVIICFSFFGSVGASSSSSGIEAEIAKLTHYAAEYETGNINYAQLVVYASNVREKMNKALGAVMKEEGGILKEEQLRSVLGNPSQITRWVWSEKEQKDVRAGKDVPAWRKIVFDGNKIQIWVNSWPSLFEKSGNQEIVYRLDIQTSFKKKEIKTDITNEIDEIKELAENYYKDPNNENANELAKKTVSVEKQFWGVFEKGETKCEQVLSDIFGSENKREEQKTTVYEIDFYQGENYDVTLRLDMCDECEWKWINFDFWIDSRGNFKQPTDMKMEKPRIDADMSVSDFKREIESIFNDLKSALEKGDFKSAYSLKGKLSAYNEAWNQKSNDVWKDIDKVFEEKWKSMQNTENSPDRNDPYYWVKQDQEKKKMAQEIQNGNYLERKQFYINLVSAYQKREYVFKQVRYEKRLIEIFGTFNQEICTNNKDDNGDGNTDCNDDQCSGKVCGEGEVAITVGNETTMNIKKLYCIMKECRAKEEIRAANESICGNHLCEEAEAENCKEDCIQCPVYDAINCSGKVIFKGRDENNCPLEPICIEEDLSCSVTEDCSQPLCGKAECIEGMCEVNSLEECREAECNDGQEKVLSCADGGEVVSEKCFDGVWKETGVNCGVEVVGEEDVVEEIKEEEVAGDSCVVKEDCGNEDDVCSNGICITIPKVEEQEENEERQEVVEEQKVEEEETETNDVPVSEIEQEVEEQTPVETITGNVVRTFSDIGAKVTGFAITVFNIEEGESTSEDSGGDSSAGESSDSPSEPTESRDSGDSGGASEGTGDNNYEDNGGREDEEREDNERERRKDEEERREQDEKRRDGECSKNCEDNCERNVIVPCVQKCVFDSKCGTNCDNEIDECKSQCKKEKDTSGCESECKEACKKGEAFEMKREEEENKFVIAGFNAGGQCRISDEKKEGGLWFDGWGEAFDAIRYLKQEYYNEGNDEWCKNELEDYIRQRREFETSFNDKFLAWFFEKYVANSAEDWEEHASGIYDLYWKDVEFSKQMARTSKCAGTELPEFNLVNAKYEGEYGKVEFWEEMQTVKLEELGGKEATLVTPYMKIWIFPSKEFVKYEMIKSMKNHEFPGKDEDKTERENGDGPTEEEKEQIKKDKGLMDLIRKMSEKYGGNVDVVAQLKDYSTNEIVFNLYVQVNENDIIKIKPMLPEEVPEQDINIEVNFDDIYNLISETEKEMSGERIESPPWGRKESIGTKVNNIANGIKVFFKVKSILNSAVITPEGADKDVNKLLNKFVMMMVKQDGGDNGQDKEQDKDLEKAVK